jgi:hypothetical protein
MADALPPPEAPERRRSNLPKILAAVAAVAAIVVILLVTGVIGGDDDDDGGDEAKAPTPEQVVRELREGQVLIGPREAPFAMRYTNDWALLSSEQLREAGDQPPLAGLRRKDRSGVLSVTLRGPIKGGIGSLEERLPDELASRFDDFRLQTIRRIDVAAGPALYTSWVRTKSGRVQSQLVVPVSNKRSFTVDTVLNANAKDAAAEVGGMYRTFDTAPAR